MKERDLVRNKLHCVKLLKEVLGQGYYVFDENELVQTIKSVCERSDTSFYDEKGIDGRKHAIFVLRENYERLAKEHHNTERKSLLKVINDKIIDWLY